MQGNLNENVKFVQSLDPDAYAATAQNGAAIDCRGFQEITHVVRVGDMGTAATLNAKVQESDASNTGFTDISGAAITQITKASPDGSNTGYIIRVRLQAPRKRYQRIVVTPGTAACDCEAAAYLSGGTAYPISQPSYIRQVVSVE